MIENVLVQIAIIVAIGVILSALMMLLKQPPIIGYIASGILVGPSVFGLLGDSSTITTFSQFGIVVLLFMVGLSLSPKVFREVGKVSLVTGLGQIVFTSLIGFGISYLLGYSLITSGFIAVALTFSSTIIIMKILSDKGDVDTLYGRISVGFLLVQDVVAMIILALVSTFFSGSSEGSMTIIDIVAILAILGALIPISLYIFPLIMKKIAKSQEFLLLFSIGWCLLLAIAFHELKFSMEIGALLAGVTLSMSPYRHEIIGKMKPLRDFFIFLFFVSLGSQMSFDNIGNSAVHIIIFSLFILIGNPLVVVILMGRMGYSKKSGFLAGLTVAQISEFSLILIALGVKTGHLTNDILSMVTFIGLTTIAGSTYAMIYSDKIFPYLSKFLSIFEKKKKMENLPKSSLGDYDVILFGYDKIGYSLLRQFNKQKIKALVIDYNPEVIKYLESINVDCMYGDAEDSHFVDEICGAHPKMIISTIPIYETNSMIIKTIKIHHEKAIVLVVSNSIEDSFKLYDQGASYVIIPRFLGGEYAAEMIEKNGFNSSLFTKDRVHHIEHLGDRKKIKHFRR